MMAAVLESSRVVCSSLDLDEVLRLIAQAAHDLSGAHSVSVMLIDEECKQLVIRAAVGIAREICEDLRVSIGEGLAGRVVRLGQAIHLADVRSHPDFQPISSVPIANLLALPLRARDRILGVLNLSRHDERSLFSEVVVQAMQVFACHAAIAITNAAATTELRRAAAREQLLSQINRVIRATNDADEVIGLALEGVGQALASASAILYRRTVGSGQGFEFARAWFAYGLHALAAYDHSPLPYFDPEAPPPWFAQTLPDGAMMQVPVVFQGRCLGWIEVRAEGKPRRWRGDEIDLARAVADQLAVSLAQVELSALEQRSRDLSAALRQLAAASNAMIGQESVLTFILEQLARFIPYDSTSVMLYRAGYTYAEVVAGRGFRSSVQNVILYVGPGSVNWRVVRDRRAILIDDVQSEPGWQHVPDSDIIRSWIGVPLLVNDRPIGMLAIDKWTAGAFTEHDVLIAQAFADHLAVAIHNDQLYQKAQLRASRLQALHRLSIRLNTMYEVDPLLDELAHLVHETFGYYQIIVATIEDDRIEVRAARGSINDIAALGDFQRPNRPCGLIEWALRHQETVLSNDVRSDPRYITCRVLGETQAALVVPIKGSTRVMGFIDIESNRAGSFDQDDVYLVEALAGQTAVALEHIARYDELRRTQEQLHRNERLRSLGELASGIAHDFNNLLAGILGHTQLILLHHQHDPAAVESLRIIERAALDGAATVRRLQDFAQTHRSSPDGPVDINMVVEESLSFTRPRWRDALQSQGFEIEIVRELGALPPTAGDGPALRELVTNLILNAVDAMPRGGTLRLRTYQTTEIPRLPAGTAAQSPGRRSPGAIVIEVSDTGVGIPPEIRERIFDPFFTTKGPHGTGMGLSMAYGVVQRHGGTISVTSVPGLGSTFTVTLPVRTPAALQLAAAVAKPQLVDASPLRVLVVDDEMAVQRVLVQLLRRWGHTVVAADSGSVAIELFEPRCFDLVCTDLGMPGISGWDLLGHVRAADREVATLLITGWGEQIDPEEAYARGADQVLVKPFDAAVLRQTISAALDQRRRALARNASVA